MPRRHYKVTRHQTSHSKTKTTFSGDSNTLKFTNDELTAAIKLLHNGKSPGLDGIHNEKIMHFGPDTRAWLLELLNDCARYVCYVQYTLLLLERS